MRELQRQTFHEHGLPATRDGLYLLQAQRYHYRHDPKICEAAVYMRCNDICRQGHLRQAIDSPVDVLLHRIPKEGAESTPCKLLELCRPDRPLIVVAGSCT